MRKKTVGLPLRKGDTMSEINSTDAGGGVLATLGVAFIVLKLCGVIHWSWWWVTAPFWMPTVLIMAIGIVALIVLGIAACFIR